MTKILVFICVSFFAAWNCAALPLSELPKQSSVHRIGIFVGTFDPLHLGHEENVQAVLDSGYVDAVIVIPQNFQVLGLQPYKPKALPIKERLEMLFFRWQPSEKIFVPTGMKEIGDNLVGGVSSWLRENMPHPVELYGIHGTDNYSSLTKRLFERLALATDATLLIEKNRAEKPIEIPERFLGRPIRVIEVPVERDLSSTELRELLINPDTQTNEIEEYMNPELFDFIRARGYYRSADGCESELSRVN